MTFKKEGIKMDGIMKAEDLKYPFLNAKREVLLNDNILFVPEKLEEYNYPTFTLFENTNPIHVEYCSGNGHWIAEKAEANPDVNWIAVEMKFERVRKIWAKMKRLGLKNLFIIWGEGAKITNEFFLQNSISEVFINFPDPWPKRRHWKNRIIQQPFLDAIHHVLAFEGKFTFVTDDLDYSKVMIQEMLNHQKFTNLHSEQGYTHEKAGYGSSFFEELWRAKGKQIRYHEFRKI